MRMGRAAVAVAGAGGDAPTLDVLQAQQQQDAQVEQQLIHELMRIHEGIAVGRIVDGPSVSLADRWRFQGREGEARRELREIRIRLEERAARMAALREQERAALHAAYRAKKAPVVARLAEALARAADINRELATLEHEEAAVTGEGVELLSWSELADETPTQESRLARWRRALAAEGDAR